jgi:deoxyribonuclease-4
MVPFTSPAEAHRMVGMGKWIGAHVSASGGVENAPTNAQRIGANALALFTKNQRQWSAKPYTEENIDRFKANLSELGIGPEQVLPHSSYLINLGAPDDATRQKSLDSFVDELTRVEQLGLRYLNFHPGSSKGEISAEECMDRIADAMKEAIDRTKTAVLVLENTAGQGSTIGASFEELADIIERCKVPERIGVCIDTCHAFAAGYELRTGEGWQNTMSAFERTIGLEYLCGFHLNDSKADLGSRKDRHESIGKGMLGEQAFRHVVADERSSNLPLILETVDPDLWADEIELLRSFA